MSAGADAAGSAELLRFIRQGRSFSGHEPHCVFLNTHTPRFADISAVSGLNLQDDGRAVGQVDWDQDGDLDLWILNRNGPQLRFMRNALPQQDNYLAVSLRGTRCNRDAIGACIEIGGEDSHSGPIRRTLRAGDGYLSQSSKWLHVGLGRRSHVQRLVVHWPDGTHEEFHDLAVNRRYRITQGTGQAEIWQRTATPRQWDVTAAARPVSPADVHVLSLSELPLPGLTYRTFNGESQSVFDVASKRPVLLTLWAGWCQPCLAELSELVQRQHELRSVGLEIVALSVSDVTSGDANTADQEILRQLAFPYRAGIADARLVQVLQLVNNYLFDLHLPLPIPTSVLIDRQGRLSALYKGRVSVERLLRDVELLDRSREERRVASRYFAGQWVEPLNSIALVPLLDEFIAGGLLAEADDFVRRLPAARKERLLPALVRLGLAFYRQGDGAKAQEHFRVAVRIDPKFVGVEIALGQQREQEGRPESAVRLYREALRRDPQSVAAMNNLAWLLATHPLDSVRDEAEAVRLAEQATRLTDQRDSAVLDTLGAAYAAAGDFAKARQTARQAIQLSRSQGRLELTEQIERHLAAFDTGQPIRQSSVAPAQ